MFEPPSGLTPPTFEMIKRLRITGTAQWVDPAIRGLDKHVRAGTPHTGDALMLSAERRRIPLACVVQEAT